jgi:carbon storage regulator
MLVLSRQRDETILIGDDIELTVVDIRGEKVRLGIKAPAHIAVHRKEIYDAIRKENEEAAKLMGGELNVIRRSVPAAARGPDGALALGAGWIVPGETKKTAC